ncbi:MAG: hypothetical protein OCD76_03170 [Reichenbachiella sp.]
MKKLFFIILVFHCFSSFAQVKTDSIYVVKKGENLWSITEELYGNGFIAYDLWFYRFDHHYGNPDLIYPGDTLNIPIRHQPIITDKSNNYESTASSKKFESENRSENRSESYDEVLISLNTLANKANEIADGSFYDFAPFSLLGICISFIVAIMGIALPLSVQTISKFQEKYDSLLIRRAFELNFSYRWFMISLKVNLAVIGVLVFLKFFQFEAYWLELIEAILLIPVIVFFFRLISIIRSYDTPTALFQYLKKKGNPSALEVHPEFNTIRDLMLYGIRTGKQDFCYEISKFYYDEFNRYREGSSDGAIIYPRDYYELIWNLLNELSDNRSERMTFLVKNTVGAIWIVGHQDIKLSQESFSWIWIYLRHAVSSKNEAWVLDYWKTAHDFLSQKRYSIENISENLSQNELDRYTKFHLIVGGLIDYSNNYPLLKRMLDYTTSEPPNYKVYPVSILSIIELYNTLSGHHTDMDLRHYRFENAEGVNFDGPTIKYTKRFLGILFIRQFSYHKGYHVYHNPTENIPTNIGQDKKRQYISNLESLQKVLDNLLSDNQLVQELSFNGLKVKVQKYLENNLQSLKDAFSETEREQPIDQGKKDGFIANIKGVNVASISQYNIVFQKNFNGEKSKNFFLGGMHHIMDRAPFAMDQGVSHLNYDSFLQQSASNKFCEGVSEIFFLNRSKRYYLSPQEIEKAIDKLLPKNSIKSDYILIGFGINVEFLKLDLPNITDSDIHGIKLVNYDRFNSSLLKQSLFLIRKSNLPSCEFLEIEKDLVKKLELTKLSDVDFNIYGGVANLNENETLRKELVKEQQMTEDELKRSVYISVAYNAKVQWQKGVDCIQIELYYDYYNNGNPNSLDEIEQLN